MKKKMPKPRDVAVVHMVARKQGAHGKPYKSIRKQEKINLKKDDLSSERKEYRIS